MKGEELRRALHEGRRVYGTCILSPSPSWPGAVAGSGADFVFIDTEHTARDREVLAWMCRAYAALGLPPVVRIPSPDPYAACQVFDGGAQGVIAPYIETAEQVRQLVGAARYRPLKGQRLQGALVGESLEPELATYLEERNAGSMLIVNIESVPAVEHLDEILAVPGLDAVLIGPHDLSCSLGIPEQYRHPRFDAAVCDIMARARAAGLGAGIHHSAGMDQEIDWARRSGANLILHSSDLSLFAGALRRDLRDMRAALGGGPTSAGGDGTVV